MTGQRVDFCAEGDGSVEREPYGATEAKNEHIRSSVLIEMILKECILRVHPNIYAFAKPCHPDPDDIAPRAQ